MSTQVAHFVIAYTDGSSLGNPGPAGWGWYIDEDRWHLGGSRRETNIVAEGMAILTLLRQVPADVPLLIRTDSEFTINAVTKWMAGWKRRGWKKADGQPPANLSLLKELDAAVTGRKVHFEWVRGHAGNHGNEIADRLATKASSAIRNGQPIPASPGWSPGAALTPVTLTASKAPAKAPAKAAKPAGKLPTRPTSRTSATRRPAARPTRARRGRGIVDRSWDESDDVTLRPRSSGPAPVLCLACDAPINPITNECACSA